MFPTRPSRLTFLAKAAAAGALVALATFLFYGEEPGWTLGAFALAWTIALLVTRADVRRHRGARIALVAAAALALALIDDPSPLDWVLCCVAIGSAALLPRRRFHDALSWGGMLLVGGLRGLGTPWRDTRGLMAVRRRRPRRGAALASVLLPVVGGGIFLALFAIANPVIGHALSTLRLDPVSMLGHLAFWIVVLALVWPMLRPSRHARPLPIAPEGITVDVPAATLVAALVTFNAVFALQNGLDIAFLWSGAPLPAGVTLADYAHRGAYPLIVTALLAGTFVLVASRPGGAGERDSWVRRLIVLWTAQNVLLVASSILRTLDYVAAYSLTVLRIAALAWMALVAAGLLLILWRMLAARSLAWLINANALAAAAVLAVASVADLGAIAATWNVRHARTARDLDLCYLERLGGSALLPLIALERRAGGPVLRDRAARVRGRVLASLAREQADWHSWTWRGARRLAAARALAGPASARFGPRECDRALTRGARA